MSVSRKVNEGSELSGFDCISPGILLLFINFTDIVSLRRRIDSARFPSPLTSIVVFITFKLWTCRQNGPQNKRFNIFLLEGKTIKIEKKNMLVENAEET